MVGRPSGTWASRAHALGAAGRLALPWVLWVVTPLVPGSFCVDSAGDSWGCLRPTWSSCKRRAFKVANLLWITNLSFIRVCSKMSTLALLPCPRFFKIMLCQSPQPSIRQMKIPSGTDQELWGFPRWHGNLGNRTWRPHSNFITQLYWQHRGNKEK